MPEYCNTLTSLANKQTKQCSDKQDESGTHFTLLQTLALLADKIKIHATQNFFTVILIVTQNCVFDTDTQGTAMNIILYTRRLSSLAQSLKEHGKFSGDPEAAVRSYMSVLLSTLEAIACLLSIT